MILFFYGPNNFAARQKIKELVERFKTTSGNNFGLERFDGTDPLTEPQAVISAISSVPFLSSHRLVIIEDLLANKTLAEAVINGLDQVPRDNVVVFYERAPDERTKAFKELKKIAKTHKFEPLKPPALMNWLKQIIKDNGGQIDPPTARFLIERAGPDQWRLQNEIQKLINFNPQISRAAILELIEPQFEQTIFDLIDNLHRGRADKVLELYHGLRSAKAQPLYVLSMLGWGVRNLIIAKAGEGKPAGEIARDFGLNPFVVNKSLAASRRLDLDSLKQIHRQLLETDYRLKTTPSDPDIALEQLLLGISSQLTVAT